MLGFAPQLLAPAVQLMRERAPEVEIVIQEGLADDLLADLMQNRVDLILSHLELAKTERDLVVDPIYRESVGIFSSLRHPLARRRKVGWGELVKEKWVLPRAGTTSRAVLDRNLRLYTAGKLPMMIEATTPHFIVALVRECNMLAALPMGLVRWLAEDLRVVARVRVEDNALEWPICATRMRSRRVSAAVLLFTDCLKAAAARTDRLTPPL